MVRSQQLMRAARRQRMVLHTSCVQSSSQEGPGWWSSSSGCWARQGVEAQALRQQILFVINSAQINSRFSL